MQRYFSVEKDGNEALSDNDRFHLLHVMRSRAGDRFELVGTSDIKLMIIDSVEPFSYHMVSSHPKQKCHHQITLLYCLPKGDKLDLVIQKATELGAYEMIGLISKRTIVRLNQQDIQKKSVRYERIIKEASEQCFRDDVMKWGGVFPFEAIKEFAFDKKYIAYEEEKGSTRSFFQELESLKPSDRIAILVGPEGGFEESEVRLAEEHGFLPISLGKRILRSETAAIMSVGLLSFILERDDS